MLYCTIEIPPSVLKQRLSKLICKTYQRKVLNVYLYLPKSYNRTKNRKNEVNNSINVVFLLDA